MNEHNLSIYLCNNSVLSISLASIGFLDYLELDLHVAVCLLACI